MENISVELILLIVLGSVFVIDFVLKGLKRSSKKMEGVIPFKKYSNENKASTRFDKTLQYFIDRPRNIVLYFFSIWIFKILINASVFKFYWNGGKIVKEKPRGWSMDGRSGFFDFGDYIRYSFEINFESFLYSFITLTFIVWQLNPHIKKR